VFLHACERPRSWHSDLTKAPPCTWFVLFGAGATSIEYGLIAAGISLVIIGVVKNIGTKLNTTFGSISTQLK